MADTFTWQPDSSPTGTVGFRTRSAKFGDGYEQRAEDGINNHTQSWALTFTGQKSRILEIAAFLNRQAGAKAFNWAGPMGDISLYRCAQYQPRHVGGNVYTLTATFEQAFHP